MAEPADPPPAVPGPEPHDPAVPVVVVEGESDRIALETAAAVMGTDLAGARFAVLGGATNAGRLLVSLPRGTRVVGMYDEAEERWFRNGLQRAGFGRVRDRLDLEAHGFSACVRDLEDELVRALGPTRVRDVVERQGELAPLQRLQDQPAQRARTTEQQLHRFLGSRSGRKALYARLLVEALEPDELPGPLTRVVAAVTAG